MNVLKYIVLHFIRELKFILITKPGLSLFA